MFPRRTEAGQAPPPARSRSRSPLTPARNPSHLPARPEPLRGSPGAPSPPTAAARGQGSGVRRPRTRRALTTAPDAAAGLRGCGGGSAAVRAGGARGRGRPPGAAFPARRVPLAAARTRGTPRPALGVSATAAAAAVWGNAAGQGAPRAQSALMRASSLPASPPPPPPRDQAPCRAASRAAAAACPRRGASPEAEGRALERGPDLSRTRGVSATPGPELAPEAPGGGVRAPAWPSRRGALVAPRGRWPAGGGWG